MGKKITVSGEVRLRVSYQVELNMSEQEFDALSEREQNEHLENAIDWLEAGRNAEVDEFDVDDVIEIEEK
ncbi:hypothetical protein BKP37_00610 [Anaerobacillus alkalilacustris]|uniref:Uncharacterized protein n=1 Tax=Anaerobacillus alkalilacustris TaxID=393763 RepID=A0A1S2M016_9BACI|nr:hypothetical protein [Anaerobacillus alkalilacustris]OIJ17075.1 hypothetical protein BKP37_00610 [Anaerobacillus alkalilacustris]